MATRKKASSKAKVGEVVPFDPKDSFALQGGDWEEELQGAISEQQASVEGIGAGWSFISTRGGMFSIGDESFGQELDVIIVSAGKRNLYFGGEKFDENNIKPPVCYAIAVGEEELAPPKSDAIRKLLKVQNETCEGCWANAFGTNERGGKACGNYIRLALVPAFSDGDLQPKSIRENSGAVLQIPPTSLRNWLRFVKMLGKRPMQSVVTNVKILPDKKHQFQITLEPKSSLASTTKDERYAAVMSRRSEAVDQVRLAPNLTRVPEPAGKGKKAPRKKVSRKKVRKTA